MLSLDSIAIQDWLSTQPGSGRFVDTGLGEDVLPTVQLALEHLADRLEQLRQAAPQRLSERLMEPSVCIVLNALLDHLSFGRRLRLLFWIGEIGLPNGREILAALYSPEALPPGSGERLRRDMGLLHRSALIETIFSPDRIARVQRACDRGDV